MFRVGLGGLGLVVDVALSAMPCVLGSGASLANFARNGDVADMFLPDVAGPLGLNHRSSVVSTFTAVYMVGRGLSVLRDEDIT